MPARCAANTFSFTPPTGSTAPRRVASPVIARVGSTLRPVRRDTIAVSMVTPALGPSFGIAPEGTWMCTSVLSNTSGSIPNSAEAARM